MNSRQGIVKKKQETFFEISIDFLHYFKILLQIRFRYALVFLTIPKPLKQHPILKKIIHSALRGVGSPSRRLIFKDLGKKLPFNKYLNFA